MAKSVKRRRLLQLLATGNLIGIAGCNQDQNPTVTPTEASPTGTSSQTSAAETTESKQDQESPNLSARASPTNNAGEVHLLVEAQDNVGLTEIVTKVNGDQATQSSVSGKTATLENTFTDEKIDSLYPGENNSLTIGVRDQSENYTEKTVEGYVRKYNLNEETRLEIGAVYISQQGDGFRQQCRDSYEETYPAIGIYDEDPIPTETTSKHIDQMTGHGINRLVYDYGGGGFNQDERIATLLDSPLIDQIEIEPFYTKTEMVDLRMDENWKETVLPEDLTLLRDTLLSQDNIATIDGRPVVSTWNFTYFFDDDSDAHDKLLDEFGSYEAFVQDMRSHLRVNGTDPFLIVGKGPTTVVEDSRIGDFVDLFDGMTTWFPPGPWRQGEEDSWEAILDRVETYFKNNSRYATDHDMEFTPRVFPGYNDIGSGCGRTGHKQFPRSTERFRQLLDLAEEYATRDRIDIATWNDWTEGHQIEPGTFKGNEYGTSYLEVVEKFQRGD